MYVQCRGGVWNGGPRLDFSKCSFLHENVFFGPPSTSLSFWAPWPPARCYIQARGGTYISPYPLKDQCGIDPARRVLCSAGFNKWSVWVTPPNFILFWKPCQFYKYLSYQSLVRNENWFHTRLLKSCINPNMTGDRYLDPYMDQIWPL